MKYKLRIVRKKDVYILQRRYSVLWIFHRWKPIFSSTAYGDVLLLQFTYVPQEVFGNNHIPIIGTSGIIEEMYKTE